MTVSCLEQTSHLGSEKFGFISSSNLVSQFEKHGLTLDKVVEMKIRKNKLERQGFQKHRMLFNTGLNVKDGTLQMLVTNSHEGSSALKFQLGFFRFVCSNGLVVGNDIVMPISIRHTIDNVERLNDSISMILNQKNNVYESIESMAAKKFNEESLKEFTQKALDIRGYDKKDGILIPDFRAKRREDTIHGDVFSVFNIVQENILRTGFDVYNEQGDRKKLRAIKSLDEQNRINTELWSLAHSIAA
jgi:hypothetical protein